MVRDIGRRDIEKEREKASGWENVKRERESEKKKKRIKSKLLHLKKKLKKPKYVLENEIKSQIFFLVTLLKTM